MKRGKLITFYMQAWQRQFGYVQTSSASAIREAMHEALDVWLDEIFADLDRPGSVRGPLDQATIEVRR